MIGVVISRADDASTTIGRCLRELADWTERSDESCSPAHGGGTYYARPGFEVRTFDELHLDLVCPAEAFTDPDLLVFASRHAGETGPLLTAHFTGNFGEAEHGGSDGELAAACPNAHAVVLDALSTHAPPAYEVGMECTHHGPSAVGAPSMFVEIGSTAAEWTDRAAGEAVARAILELAGVGPDRDRTVVGFGGGHYAPRFERIVRETDWAVGHVAADWCLEAMAGSESVIDQAFRKSNAKRALVATDDPRLEAQITSRGYQLVSETWLRETTGVDLALATSLESTLCSIESGLRLGTLAQDSTPDREFEVLRPDPDLLADLASIDARRTRSIVRSQTLAFETADGGSRVAGRLAVPERARYDQLVAEFCELLSTAYESVTRTAGTIEVVEEQFDPTRAAELGVPEGPAYGRLADGDPVDVDGRTIDPEAVHERRVITYAIEG